MTESATIRIRTTEATTAWRAVLMAFARVNHRLEADLRESFYLGLGWYEVLLQLASSPTGRLRMSEVADGMILSRSATTRLVDRLEAEGLVERMVCDEDRRGMEVGLTEIGRERFVAAGRVHLRGIEEYFGAHLTSDELGDVARLLSRVADANA
jgi:DNA-binding MarR family transcriptional regulator